MPLATGKPLALVRAIALAILLTAFAAPGCRPRARVVFQPSSFSGASAATRGAVPADFRGDWQASGAARAGEDVARRPTLTFTESTAVYRHPSAQAQQDLYETIEVMEVLHSADSLTVIGQVSDGFALEGSGPAEPTKGRQRRLTLRAGSDQEVVISGFYGGDQSATFSRPRPTPVGR